MRGRGVNTSYTFALTFHLRNHSTEWQNFLDNLASQIVPDNKTKYEHFKQMEAPKAYSKEESNKRFDESNICRNLIEENIAGVAYIFRDREFLQNLFHKFIEGHNAQMLEYLFKFSNKNISLFYLMGTKHPIR